MQRNEARLKFFALEKTFVTFFTIRFKDPNLGSEQVGASLQHPILFIHPLEGHFKGVHTIGFSKYQKIGSVLSHLVSTGLTRSDLKYPIFVLKVVGVILVDSICLICLSECLFRGIYTIEFSKRKEVESID